ncbi:MAG: hypothetical protein ACL93V_07120 [Candidatus Electrothrix sp. YB6]
MSSLSQEDKELLNQLNRQPNLKTRIQAILSIAGDDGDGIVKADEAESRVIEEVRRMGNEVLSGWAESRIEKSGAALPTDGNCTRSGQKNTLASAVSVKSPSFAGGLLWDNITGKYCPKYHGDSRPTHT